MRVLLGSDRETPTRKVSLRLLWEPRDLWVGVFWNRIPGYLLVYVSAIPALPLCVAIRRSGEHG